MTTNLPKYSNKDFTGAYPREKLTDAEGLELALIKSIELSVLMAQALTLQAGGIIKKSTNPSPLDVTLYPVKEQQTSVASNGISYTSKVVYEDVYYRITVWYSESGSEIKRDETKLP